MAGRFRSALCGGVILLAFGPIGVSAQPAAPAQSPAAIPRMPDGHPDLNGIWTGTGGNAKVFDEETDTGSNNVAARNGRMANYENDNGLTRLSLRNKPQYKPEFWDRIRDPPAMTLVRVSTSSVWPCRAKRCRKTYSCRSALPPASTTRHILTRNAGLYA